MSGGAGSLGAGIESACSRALQWSADLPPGASFLFWVILLCGSGVVLVWMQRRWRAHRRGLSTLALGALALVLAGAGMLAGRVIPAPPVQYAGSIQFPWQSAMTPRSSDREEIRLYQQKMMERAPATLAHLFNAARADAARIDFRAYPVKRQGADAGIIIVGSAPGKPAWISEPWRALCMLLSINGQPVRGAYGGLLSLEFGRAGPATAVGQGSAASWIGTHGNVHVTHLPVAVTEATELRLEWALVLLGEHGRQAQMDRFESVIVAGPEVVVDP